MTINELTAEIKKLFTRAGCKSLAAYFVLDKKVMCIRIGEPADVVSLLESIIEDEEKLVEPKGAFH